MFLISVQSQSDVIYHSYSFECYRTRSTSAASRHTDGSGQLSNRTLTLLTLFSTCRCQGEQPTRPKQMPLWPRISIARTVRASRGFSRRIITVYLRRASTAGHSLTAPLQLQLSQSLPINSRPPTNSLHFQRIPACWKSSVLANCTVPSPCHSNLQLPSIMVGQDRDVLPNA